MNNFTYQYPVRQHFGKGCAESAIKEEMKQVGKNVLLAYGGGSLKRTGLYDTLMEWLHECDKNVVDFGGILPNPTYDKVQEGAQLVRKYGINFILAVGGGSVIDCCKIVSAQARLNEDVWDIWQNRCGTEQTAALGIDALESFIREIGLPTRWSEMGITDETILRAAADTCLLMPGCCKQFTRDELFEVLKERL